jgi:hypothetical protein
MNACYPVLTFILAPHVLTLRGQNSVLARRFQLSLPHVKRRIRFIPRFRAPEPGLSRSCMGACNPFILNHQSVFWETVATGLRKRARRRF